MQLFDNFFQNPYHASGFTTPRYAHTAKPSTRKQRNTNKLPPQWQRNMNLLKSMGASTEEATEALRDNQGNFDRALRQINASRARARTSSTPRRRHRTGNGMTTTGATQSLQLRRLFDELNDQYSDHTGQELASPTSFQGWTRDDVYRYVQSDGSELPPHLRPAKQQLAPEAAAVKLQAVYRGWVVRRSGIPSALKKRKLELSQIAGLAAEATKKFEPWVFDLSSQTMLESKQVAGVPVPLIEYEEMLLREQLKLDGMMSCGLAADVMRSWRKKANCQLQDKLNQIDACREEWRQSHREAASVA